MGRLLVLRPEPGGSATVERAREQGIDAISIPLFEIEPVEWETPDPESFDGLLLTSANAIRFGGSQLDRLRAIKVYAVGKATADAALESGFEIAEIGERGVEQLLGTIDPSLKLLHLSGARHREPNHPRQTITRLAVYRSNPVDTPDLSADLGSVAVIHSPSAGRRFAKLIRDRSRIAIAAISEEAARAAGGGWKEMISASEPTDEALLALAARLCNKPDPE